jgi:hypothetical protein
LYGSEGWLTQEKHVSRKTATEMRCYGKIVGKTKRDWVRSERIREQVGQESVRIILEERELKWFSHVYRMEREKTKAAQVEGRKQRGRQRITFESRIEEIGSRRRWHEIEKCGRGGGSYPRRCNGTTGAENKKEMHTQRNNSVVLARI